MSNLLVKAIIICNGRAFGRKGFNYNKAGKAGNLHLILHLVTSWNLSSQFEPPVDSSALATYAQGKILFGKFTGVTYIARIDRKC